MQQQTGEVNTRRKVCVIPAPAHRTLQPLSHSSGSGSLFCHLSVSSFSPFFVVVVCLPVCLFLSVFFCLSGLSLHPCVCLFLSVLYFSPYLCLCLSLSVSLVFLSLPLSVSFSVCLIFPSVSFLSVLPFCLFVSFSVCTLLSGEGRTRR